MLEVTGSLLGLVTSDGTYFVSKWQQAEGEIHTDDRVLLALDAVRDTLDEALSLSGLDLLEKALVDGQDSFKRGTHGLALGVLLLTGGGDCRSASIHLLHPVLLTGGRLLRATDSGVSSLDTASVISTDPWLLVIVLTSRRAPWRYREQS